MTPGTLTETGAVCASLYCGLCIGLSYDLFALIRLPFKNPWAAGVLDALYCAAAFALAAFAMLYINCGTLRLYVFLLIGLGIYLYARFPRRLFKAAISATKAKFTKKQLRPGR